MLLGIGLEPHGSAPVLESYLKLSLAELPA
jgi:hypothetical protein